MQITSKQGQWMGDMAVRESGSIESVVEMAIVNDCSITEKMAVGSTLLKPTPIDRRVMNYYKINNIYPATATEPKGKSFGGIGYMAVQVTFIVS
jgi:hypothetical protein